MKKILLIEDNLEIRENIEEILNFSGYLVLTAKDGLEGISTAKENKPDLIICDIMMPIVDGYGFLHMMQKNEALQFTPLIFLTAKTEKIEIRKGMSLGADDYITKPFDATDLLNSVEARLKKSELLKHPLETNLNGVNKLISVTAGKDYLAELKEGRCTNKYKKKQIIYSEGNHPSRLYYLSKGKVKTYKRNDDGKDLVTGLFNEGDFLGYISLIENKTYRETAVALEECELSIIPRSEFDELLNANSEVMKKFIEILAHNVEEKEDQLLAIAYNSLRKKVSDALVLLYRKYNASNNSDFFIDFSRDNLAAIAGVAKESLIRMLGEFRDELIIELEGSKIKIVDISKLEKMHN